MFRAIAALASLLLLAACGAEPKWASDEWVSTSHYVADGPPTITLFTVINNTSGAGGHSSLMISGSERVLFDPAGTWYHPQLPERNDLHYGITDAVIDYYIDYHARKSWRVVRQDIVVSPEVAEQAIVLAKNYGAVPKSQCAISVSTILRQLPGFENVPRALFPERVMKAFGKLPGVVETVYYDDDPDNNGTILTAPIQVGELGPLPVQAQPTAAE